MAKRRREPSPIGTTPTEAAETAYNTVFIDTSLDTHLAMLVSHCDTVSDFKEKITMEHMQCFPKFGKIKIQSLKVKRRGNFYHLPDFMLVRCAFEGIKRNWFLSAETSSLKEFNYNNISSAPDEKGNLLSIKYPRGDGQSIILPADSPKILPPIHESKSQNIPTADGHSSDMYSDANRISALKMLLSDGNDEANVVSEMTFGLKVDDKTGDNSVEQYLRTGSPPKKKHKRKHGKDGSHGPVFELERSGILASTKDTISCSQISGSGNSLVGIPESEDAQQRKHNLLEATAALSGVQTDRFQNEVGDVFDKRSQLESAVVKEYKVGSNQSTENHLDSGNRKEDSMLESKINVPEISMVEKHEMFGSDVATVQLEGNAWGPSLRTEKRKKKRRGNHTDNYTPLHKSAPMVSHEETDQTDMEENQKEFSVNHDPEAMQSKKLGPKDQGEAGGNITESAWLEKQSDACGERGHDSGRKRRSKKSSAKILQETDVKHSNNVTCADVPNLEFNNTKNESILTPSETCQTTEIDVRNLLANHEPIKVLRRADVTIKEPNLSAKLLDANGSIEGTNSCGIKRKKKKKKNTQKSAAKIQDASVIEHSTEKGESMENYTHTLRCKSNEQESGLSINHDPEAMQPLNSNSLVCDKPDITPNETISREQLLDIKTVVEPGSSRGTRKKKSVKKSDPHYLEASGLEHTSKVNGTSSDEKRLGNSFNNGKDVIKRKSLEGSAGCAFEEVDNANGNEENLLPLAQNGRTKQSTEVTGEKITMMEGENLNPADSCYIDLPPDEQEKQVKSSQLDQVHKIQENTGHMDKKEKEEIEKKQLTASKDHESSPIKYQEVGAEDLTASNDKLGMTCNPSVAAKGKLNRASPPSQLVVSEMEVGKEKLKRMPETDLRTDNLINNFENENENEGINFKSYFIPSQQQDKIASSGGVKVSNKSNQKMKAEKNKKKHDSPSVSATLNVQNSVVSYENQVCENTSVVRHEKLPSNHDQSEVMFNTKKSSKVSENLEKASSQTDVAGTGTLQKPEETPSAYDSEAIRAAAAHLEENNKSLAGSSSKRSNTFTEKRRDKSRQSDVANRITSSKNDGIDLNSSPQKKSLLARSGTMFWDNVSESSGDENGTLNLNASTCTPSDSSSSSGNSVGESELSQKSTRNGSNGVKKTVAGGKNILKSDLSGKKNITMDMLLRSSASFKKSQAHSYSTRA